MYLADAIVQNSASVDGERRGARWSPPGAGAFPAEGSACAAARRPARSRPAKDLHFLASSLHRPAAYGAITETIGCQLPRGRPFPVFARLLMVPELSDVELIARVGKGDVFAYTAIVRRHLANVYRTAYRMLHDKCEAEDVAQETFARLWQKAPGWEDAGAGVPAWLGRVCTHLCIDRLRGRGRWASGELPEVTDPAVPADRLIEQGECRDILENCLEALPSNHRAAIVLTYYEGYSNKIASDIMRMDIKAFESLLHRARRKLGTLLSQGGVARQDLELLA